MATLAQNRIVEELKKDLFSGDDLLVMKALNKTREKGNQGLVEPLIALFATTSNENFKIEIADILSTLKVSGIEPIFIEALSNPAFVHIRKNLLEFMWSSGLQPANAVPALTDLALAGPYDVAFEALTLLESIEDPIEEGLLLDGITRMKQALGSAKEHELTVLWTEYLNVLESRAEMDELDSTLE